jgi:hypothetical protein
MERRRLFGLLAGVCAVAIAAALLFTLFAEHWRTESPDRAFVAVAQVERLYALISVLPGQHGDRPGYVTLYRGNRPCGSVWVPLVSLAYGLRWDIDARPRRAAILTATWNLETCRIERMFTGLARRIAGASPRKAATQRRQTAWTVARGSC